MSQQEKCTAFTVVSDSLRLFGLYSPWNSPSPNTGVGSLSLLQGIFPTQGLNPGLPHCRWILYQLSHQGSPRKQEWVVYPVSRGSSNPGIKPGSPALQADSLPAELPGKTPAGEVENTGPPGNSLDNYFFKVQLIYNCFLFHKPSSELRYCK